LRNLNRVGGAKTIENLFGGADVVSDRPAVLAASASTGTVWVCYRLEEMTLLSSRNLDIHIIGVMRRGKR
jgi:hypothetical protein